MPVRATKRGAARVPFPPGADADVLICGASFAGLTVARELRATGARVLVLDRYEIGERQTSACAAPTEWLRNLGLEASIRQTFDSLLVHTPRRRARPLAAAVHVLDVRLPRSSASCCGSRAARPSSRPRRSSGRTGSVVRTDRGDVTRAADRRRTRLAAGARAGRQRAAARGAAVARPGGASGRRRRGPRAVDRPALRRRRLRLVVPGARRAADRRRLVRPARPGQAADAAAGRGRRRVAATATRATGSRTGIRPAAEDGVFFAGDSAGPLPAADRRGHPDGVLLRDRAAGASCAPCSTGRQDRAAALERYGAFSASHRWKFEAMYAAQQSIRHLHGRPLDALTRVFTRPRVSRLGVPALPGDRAAVVRGAGAAGRGRRAPCAAAPA